jgi:flagellar basal body-associated protein FliL
MMKKVVIVGFIVCLFVISAFLVSATDHEEKSFTDPEDDVLDYSGDEPIATDKKPNVDIVDITYVKDDKQVTLTLQVKGVIENRGDIQNEESLNFVSYMISLYTLDHSYDIVYVNNDYNFTIDQDVASELTYHITDAGSTLTFIFDLMSQDETYDTMEAATWDVSITKMYMDGFPDTPEELTVKIAAPSTGKVGQSISFSATVSGGTSYEYEWDFGDGNTSTIQNPTHTYQQEGTYTVSITVSDSDTGGYGADVATITVSASVTSSDGSDENSGSSGLLPFIVLVVVIVVAGIAVVVYVMRR